MTRGSEISTKSYKLLKKTIQVWKGKHAQTQPRMNRVAAWNPPTDKIPKGSEALRSKGRISNFADGSTRAPCPHDARISPCA